MTIDYNNNNDTNQDINDMIVLIVRLEEPAPVLASTS